MKEQYPNVTRFGRAVLSPLLLSLAVGTATKGQQSSPRSSPTPPSDTAFSSASQSNATVKLDTRITPEQAKQLFALAGTLLRFSSQETGLPIKRDVKCRLTTRAAVEAYIEEKLNNDEGTERLQREEIVLKKLGMLDHDFQFRPFLLALLKEQIEAYYDSKTKTVNMLDWVDVKEQESALVHEVTHALQDQHSDLEKWDNQTPDDVSHDEAGDQDHLAKDEMDTARAAVTEGQASAVAIDYLLKPRGKSLVKDPEVLNFVTSEMSFTEDTTVMARAPLLLSESMLFPYREGLRFEQGVWMDQGQSAAFPGALDRPPTSSWEIINPREYERKGIPAVPLMPNVHPLVDPFYQPYAIGQMGQLDVRILTKLFGGENAARHLTPAWDGGLYWAGQLRSALTPAERDSTKSLALFYLSIWKNADSAQVFARLYADSLGRKYSNLKLVKPASDDGTEELVYSTNEGPVVITTRDKMVFVTESFPFPLARKLAALILDAQGARAIRMTTLHRPNPDPANPARPIEVSSEPAAPLAATLVRFLENCGVMKVAADAEVRAVH